ncbi:unnamed protein product [Didymodactylos carnosus]|uniref:Protein-tyrosine-phosphatase n=1 Tax=Didymodactylos carnosus TaxID=1234261 RepID=A0A8S2T2D6_9BILA|nr:unnamed protein product [Didymodactylos carnosus]CAF4265416.1 unnamed protein product [Didymodactylos carnosus]
MGHGMSQILPDVYVSSAFVAHQQKVIDDFGITHILSIQTNPSKKFPNIEYLLITAKDNIQQDLLQHISQCNDFIHNARLNNGRVLIHCVEGKSRSPTIAIAYLTTVTGFSWIDSMNSIRGVRQLVEPNFSFQRQLKRFDEELGNTERVRLFSKFGDYISTDNDRRFLLNNLELYKEDQKRRFNREIDMKLMYLIENPKSDGNMCSNETKDYSDKHQSLENEQTTIDYMFQTNSVSQEDLICSEKLLDEMFA